MESPWSQNSLAPLHCIQRWAALPVVVVSYPRQLGSQNNFRSPAAWLARKRPTRRRGAPSRGPAIRPGNSSRVAHHSPPTPNPRQSRARHASKNPGWNYGFSGGSAATDRRPPAERNSAPPAPQLSPNEPTLFHGFQPHPLNRISAPRQGRSGRSASREPAQPPMSLAGKRRRSPPSRANRFPPAGASTPLPAPGTAAPMHVGTNARRAALRERQTPKGSRLLSEVASLIGPGSPRSPAAPSFRVAARTTSPAAGCRRSHMQ